jgi:AraC-like DNA-binding protein
MLKEKSTYREELPINITVANIVDYPIHFHNDLEVVYVLGGSVRMKNGYYNYILKEGDIFILNPREIHSFENNGEKNMVMMLQMDTEYFSHYYDNLKNSFFVTDMEDDSDESLDLLRSILARIMMEVMEKGCGHEAKIIENTHNLLSNLFADFQYYLMEDGKFVNGTKHKGNKILAGRLSRITDYMYANYTRKLTLSEIAEREHLSIYYLSHVIKEATGLSFQELLSFIRVEESEKFLLGSNKKIGAIADETGFSAVRYYIKHFERWFGMHPLEYRKKYTGKVASIETVAKIDKYSPAEIEGAIRRNVKGVYSDYLSSKKAPPIIVELDIMESIKESYLPEQYPLDFLDNEMLKPVARPYILLKSLKEKLLVFGENYILSSSARSPGGFQSFSILVYNVGSDLKKNLARPMAKEHVLEAVRSYDEEQEFLIRCNGISGEFKVSRYKMTRESAITSFEESLKAEGLASKRKAIVNNWSILPCVDFSKVVATDTISIRSTLKGLSAELILIDKQTNPTM